MNTDTKSALPPDPPIDDASDAQSILPPYEETPSSSSRLPPPGPTPPAYQPSMLEVDLTPNKGKGPANDFDVHVYNAELVPPAALLLDGQTIYAEDAPDIPLYRVNRGLTTLGPATKAVDLDRLEQRSPDLPIILKPRSMYTLHRPHPADFVMWLRGGGGSPVERGRPDFYMHATTARAAPLGHLGLRGGSFAHWVAVPCRIDYTTKDGKDIIKAVGWDPSRTSRLFRAQKHPTRANIISWLDVTGTEVALMYETMEVLPSSADGKPQHTPRLLVTVPIRRDQRDALVAFWCCYAWAQGSGRHVEVPLPRGKNPYKASRVFN
ncbi:hypothetical protein Sste5346_005543 [Sporothrix stenoceras]|uniref:Uncharacterized protein n=1 Tax=Sporothrix stenoceras TaxID=5173 RepID=A0ABR3Z2M0_9PEZI